MMIQTMTGNLTNEGDTEVTTTETAETVTAKKPRGFASISPERRREISSKGGKAAHAVGKAHRFTTEEAREAGKKGGVAPHKSRGRKLPVSDITNSVTD